ncbi:MAG: glycosyltransferase family 1 protein, partial [Acidimicrobiales bacterium]|nr:glycosyltransferase family 1 protein [Acidimicrobiales bacterium]
GEKVTVTPNGLRALPEADPSLVPSQPFVLAVGQLVPRKGLDGLLEAVARTSGVGLVVCGPDGGQGAELQALARRLHLDGRATFLGRVSDEQLAGLYQSAAAVVAASVDEGFGLPLLEAMAAGAPVIATDIPAFREVGGSAPRYVPVGDSAALATAITDVVEDGQAREAWAEAGRAQAARFTWAACARATIDVYESVL